MLLSCGNAFSSYLYSQTSAKKQYTVKVYCYKIQPESSWMLSMHNVYMEIFSIKRSLWSDFLYLKQVSGLCNCLYHSEMNLTKWIPGRSEIMLLIFNMQHAKTPVWWLHLKTLAGARLHGESNQASSKSMTGLKICSQSAHTHDTHAPLKPFLSLLSHRHILCVSTDIRSDALASPLISDTIHIHQVLCTAGLDSYNNYADG